MPVWTNFSIPSIKGKNASDAATISSLVSINFFILSIAIWQLSSLLGCPEPIPAVVWSATRTIALDLTYLQTLNANIRDEIVAASDAFFPFVDGIEKLVQSGVTAVIQPSGSIRDKEIIKFANETNTILVFSKKRHFRH